MQTAHNRYAVYCLVKMLQRSYVHPNGNTPPCHVANTRPVSPPCALVSVQESLRHANGGFFVPNAQRRARHA